MSDEQLRKSLDELRSELERLEAEEAQVKQRLDALISGVETRLDKPGDEALHQSLIQELRQSISQFEVSPEGKVLPRPKAALLEVLVPTGSGWSLSKIEDDESNVFHKAMV